MSFTQLKSTQKEFLEKHLRGTGKQMSAAQARATYGIQNLRARISEMRAAGLRVRKTKNSTGLTAYAISRRDEFGDQFMLWNY
jgi:Helix-turn-helix domain